MPIAAKICGLSTAAAVDAVIAGGASHVGLVFFPKSPRNVTIDQAAVLAERARRGSKVVGLFVDAEAAFIEAVRDRVHLDVLQLHGDEQPDLVGRLAAAHGIEVWKAIPVRTSADLAGGHRYRGAASRLLFDAKPPAGADLPGGNGLRFDWRLLQGYRHTLPWALSGGLDAATVAEAVTITGAPMVDVSSGVEDAPGVKSVDKIAAFLQATARL